MQQWILVLFVLLLMESLRYISYGSCVVYIYFFICAISCSSFSSVEFIERLAFGQAIEWIASLHSSILRTSSLVSTYKFFFCHHEVYCMTFTQLAVFRYVPGRTPGWLEKLKEFFEAVPSAAVGEVGVCSQI